MVYSRYIDKVEMMSFYSPDNWDSFSSLTSLLDRYLGIDNCRSMEAERLYLVSSTRNTNAAKLWRCDRNGNPLNGSLLLFDDKDTPTEYKPITSCLYPYWHCRYILKEAFFGGHLVGDPTKPIAIVQDEITALIASQVEQRFLWLAVGCGQNLTPSLLAELNSYAVTLFVDNMNMDFWSDMAKGFNNITVCKSFVERDINAYLAQLVGCSEVVPQNHIKCCNTMDYPIYNLQPHNSHLQPI